MRPADREQRDDAVAHDAVQLFLLSTAARTLRLYQSQGPTGLRWRRRGIRPGALPAPRQARPGALRGQAAHTRHEALRRRSRADQKTLQPRLGEELGLRPTT